MELQNETADRRRKRNIQVAFIAFIGLLAILTLFGNTLQSLTMPKVRTEKAVNGSLVHTLEGSGILYPVGEEKLSNPDGWKIRKILVKEGDHVKKGQKLILYDSKSAERELQDEVTHLEKQKIELQNTQDQFIQATMEGDELEIRNVKREIETRKLDLGVQERKIDELRDRLASQKELTAPFDGMITKINAVEGLASGEGDVLIANDRLGYRFEMTADAKLLSGLGISIGEKIEVQVNTSQEQQTRIVDGTIDEMANAEPRTDNSSSLDSGKIRTIPQKVLRIKVIDAELKGGEQAWVKLEKRSNQEGFVISNAAIHQDREGMFVYKIDEQRGALGNVFVARKFKLDSSETNDKETMIQSGSLFEGELIVVESSEPLQDGDRVRLQ
ncbi:efflux RND transporter periplasmic adaptor subunit [Paenibacillus sp. MSJ-34]|uniref:efflux RND transporter periplasmic adaptor subunit n=1 Tax=Paenibacillus sp. MSJ-34 TaxID=2841529 RepID=UPI001C0FB7FB|nr:biotin/lipoyl-binding protein [Paenibacillus sp. MSJ-34]MBU5442821.1 biotin/lipoyl-binding protein [Paenibacillus sp. MSJ-34]